MKIGIITGASSGIGREFAVQLQDQYGLDELWLIARREQGLNETIGCLQRVKGVAIPMDLADSAAMARFSKRLDQVMPEIKVLVNNAGFGNVASFKEASLSTLMSMIDVNVKSLVELTHICLPYMSEGSAIFQVASLNAFLPSPNGAVYSATKAFVLSFSQALYQELKGAGIQVMTVSPGPVATEFLGVASQGSMEVTGNAAQAEDVVKNAIKDASKGNLNSTFGLANRLNIFLSRVLSRKFLLNLSK